MDQIPLRTILTESINENSQNFNNYQIYIQEMVENNYENFIEQLIIELKDTEAPYNVLFLSIVLIDHCVRSSLIPADIENKSVQTKLPLKLIMDLFDIVFIYLLHPEVPVRNTSVRLFSTLAMTQITRLSEIGIDNRIIEMLSNAENYEALWSATQCIWSIIIFQYKFNEEQHEIIIQNLFRILSIQNKDITLLQSPIRMLGRFSYLINHFFHDDSKFLDFVMQILKFSEHSELSEAVYQFMDDTINQFPDILPFVVETLLANSLNDLTNSKSRDVLIALIVMWGSIFSIESTVNSEGFQPLIGPLISIMQTVSTREVIDYTEWEPYTAAFNCLQCFGYHYPEIVIPILLEYTTKSSESENSNDREGALKCLHIVFRISPMEKLTNVIPTALELLMEFLDDSEARVRYESVCTLTTIIKRLNDVQSLQLFIPQLLKLLSDTEPTVKVSFKAIKLISQFPDFEDFSELYQALTESLSSISSSLIQSAVECFTLTPNSKISADDALTSFHLLLNMITEIADEVSNGQQSSSNENLINTIDTICLTLSTIAFHCDEQVSSSASDFLTLMLTLFNDFNVPYSLVAASSISIPLPNFVKDQLQVFVPHLIKALQMFNQPTILVPSVGIIPFLLKNVDLDTFFDPLIEALFDTLKRGESSNTKAATLESFFKILCIKPLLFAPFVQELHDSIDFIICNLDTVYQSYLEDSQIVVHEICKIQLKLLSILSEADVKFIFKLCIKLIIAVSKNQSILKLNSKDIYQLICGLFTAMKEETKLLIQKVPKMEIIVRDILKQIEKSDKEIDEWLSILVNSNEA